MNASKRLVLVVGGALGALLVAVLVVGILVFNQVKAEAENREYQQCMARHGFAADEPAPAVDVEHYAEAALAAAEACIDR